MKLLLTVLYIGLFLFVSCKEEQKNIIQTITDKTSAQETQKPNFVDYALSPKTEKIVENWEAYKQLEDIAKAIKKGEFDYLKSHNQNTQTLFIDLIANIPEEVNTKATSARLTALITKLYKLENLINLSNTKESVLDFASQEFLETFSNLNFQMNKKLEKDNNTIIKP